MNTDLFDFIMGMLMIYSIGGTITLYGADGIFNLQSQSTIIKYITIVALIMLIYFLFILTSVTSSMMVLLAIIIVILLLAGQKYINNDDVIQKTANILHLDKIIYGIILCLGLFITLTASISDNTNTYNFGPIINISGTLI
jgi:hypothetical protein